MAGTSVTDSAPQSIESTTPLNASKPVDDAPPPWLCASPCSFGRVGVTGDRSPSSNPLVILLNSTCLASSIKGFAAEGKSSSIKESVSTRATQIGVSAPPSKSSKPRAKAAADICTRPSSELYTLKSCRCVACNRNRPVAAVPSVSDSPGYISPRKTWPSSSACFRPTSVKMPPYLRTTTTSLARSSPLSVVVHATGFTWTFL
mmetsp:Transcript_74289/g.227286  ORF Transcript_74289/g.227286 Transcript_74289/m.227286 type:complete len:203 (-) Transcript_74289:1788-2396(-)